jgi:hypothetical protein
MQIFIIEEKRKQKKGSYSVAEYEPFQPGSRWKSVEESHAVLFSEEVKKQSQS